MITRPRNQGLTVFNYNHIYLALLAGYGLGVSILGIVSAILGSNFIFLMLTSVGFWGMFMTLKEFFEFLKREERSYMNK